VQAKDGYWPGSEVEARANYDLKLGLAIRPLMVRRGPSQGQTVSVCGSKTDERMLFIHPGRRDASY
jgi:hypothetical protein